MPRPRSNRSAAGKSPGKSIEAQRHEQDTRINIPTAEYQSMVEEDTEAPLRVAYQRRNRDLDPQLVWRGKDEQDVGDLVVNVPPLYIQEKVHPKVLIDDLVRQDLGSQPRPYIQARCADLMDQWLTSAWLFPSNNVTQRSPSWLPRRNYWRHWRRCAPNQGRHG